jgi:hypothetical protein
MGIGLLHWLRRCVEPRSIWHDRHGVAVELIGEARLHCASGRLCGEGAHLCVYRTEDDRLHVLPRAEFHDGRFRQVDPMADYAYPMMG